MGKEQDDCSLVEEREAEMVPFTGSSEPYKRNGYFLRPISTSNLELQDAPSSPPQRKTISLAVAGLSMVQFKGWACPQRQWGQWVEKLQPIYEDLWKKAGVLDAIKASTYKIRREPSLVLGAAAFWCEETNTFLFPWSEATITLEDVMILGGFPVIGEPIKKRAPLVGEMENMEKVMISEHRKFNKTKWRKADQTLWTRQFMEREGDELEHIAFLSLWLSRYVFPKHPEGIVGQYVIPIAVRLSRGVRISIAPAVLAVLYRDLRILKHYLRCYGGGLDELPLTLWAPFSILQLWLWERFVALRPDALSFVNSGEPRVSRWHDAAKKLDLAFVNSVLQLPDGFQWRPYVISLDSWCMPPFYKEKGEWVSLDANGDDDFHSFARCLRPCELAGLDCIEQYLPHRVAMQFGLDQDIPDCISRANLSWEAAWESYDIAAINVNFFSPPRLYESDVTLRYSVWWKQHMLSYSDLVQTITGPCISMKSKKKTEKELEKLDENDEILENDVKVDVPNNDNAKLFELLVLRDNGMGSRKRASKCLKPSGTLSQRGIHKKLRLSTNGWGSMKRKSSTSSKSKVEKKKRSLKEFACDLASSDSKETLDDIDAKEDGDSAIDPTTFQYFGGTARDGFRFRQTKAIANFIGEDLQLEMQIVALKRETAEIEAKMMNLECIEEEHSKSEVSSSEE
ncbi:Serine/threonine-protein phosphatase 7 [Apostasia shenzhenica]|uniref:Serine/threonine-protein phosphatase 7 n=1 Tax=Apostasia shenzhenica TaxID=1088818 RepID=A0A2I0AFQ0_9ASPA|nr:Serine/threonine-protein phosphatase 7 [Apostasia shenzhenica]